MQNEIDLNAFQTGNNVIEVLQENQEDYNELRNKPLINDVELKGNKSTADLGLATAEQGEKAETAVQPSDLADYVTTTELNTGLATKQDELVSGTNIKTINNTSLLGEGNLSITAATSWGDITGTLSNQTDLKGALDAKANTSDLGTMASENASDYTKTSSLATVATTGDYDDLIDKPSLGTMAAESASDYTKTAGLATVATTGSYSDLSNKPTIPEGLPSQTGNSGKYLTTDGTSASWAAISMPNNIWTSDSLKAGKNIQFVQATDPYVIDENTVACWHFNDSLVDEVSSNTLSTTSSEMSISYSTSPAQAKFDKSLVITTSASQSSNSMRKLTLSTPITISGPLTIDFWGVCISGDASSANGFSFYEKDGSSSFASGKRIDIIDNHLAYADDNNIGGGIRIANTYLLPTTLSHIAITIDQNATGRLFINGVLNSSADLSSIYNGLKIKYIAMYGNYSNYTQRIVGIDELRISNVCRWTEDFQVPTSPYVPDTGESWYEVTASGLQKDVTSLPTYDSSKTQTLKNVNGVLTWVDDAA